MQTDILFVNGRHEEFPYIPMGIFGLCDFLERENLSAKIINLALYPRSSYPSVLLEEIHQIKPRYIGLIFHWKELLHNIIQVGQMIRSSFPSIPIIMGGLSAGYFGVELMKKLNFTDYIIKGDAEIPLLSLLKDSDLYDGIENLIFRKNNSVFQSSFQFQAGKELLSNISFSRLDFLKDYDEYLKKIDSYLGFPIFIGRGCVYDCEYCGGSRSAFLKHSGRTKFTARILGSILQDINTLLSFGCRHILLSHLNQFCKPILWHLVNDRPGDNGCIVNLELWDAPDSEIIRLHKAFVQEGGKKSSILLTPKKEEICNHKIKWAFDQEPGENGEKLDLEKAIELSTHCHVDIFRGYFTSRHTNLDILFKEMKCVHDIRSRFSMHNLGVHFIAYSSDPASTIIEGDKDIWSSLALNTIHKAILFDRNLSSNILLHRPKRLSEEDKDLFQRCLHLSEFYFNRIPMAYWFLTEHLGFKKFLDLLMHCSRYYFYRIDGCSYEISKNHLLLSLNCIKCALPDHHIHDKFMIDFFNLLIKWVASKSLTRNEANLNKKPEYLTLNEDMYYLSSHNYEDLFAEHTKSRRLKNGTICRLKSKTALTFNLFSNGNIQFLDKKEYDILKSFDGLTHTNALMEKIVKENNIPDSRVEERIRDLYFSRILIDA